MFDLTAQQLRSQLPVHCSHTQLDPLLQDVCKGAASFDLTAQQRAAAIADLDKAIELCEARGGQEASMLGEGAGGYADLRARLEMGRGVLLGERRLWVG